MLRAPNTVGPDIGVPPRGAVRAPQMWGPPILGPLALGPRALVPPMWGPPIGWTFIWGASLRGAQ